MVQTFKDIVVLSFSSAENCSAFQEAVKLNRFKTTNNVGLSNSGMVQKQSELYGTDGNRAFGALQDTKKNQLRSRPLR